jgi:hypothetical protein
METVTSTLTSTAAAVDALGCCAADIAALDDADLLDGQHLLTEHRRVWDVRASLFAAEIARRSTRDLGQAGLAQKNGFGSAEKLIQKVTGTSHSEATRLVSLGTMMAEVEAVDDLTELLGEGALGDSDDDEGPALPVVQPWYEPVTRAVTGGRISLDAGDAIRRGLGVVSDAVPAEDLRTAAASLVERAAAGATIDQLWRDAHLLRDELDAAGIQAREDAELQKRSLTFRVTTDGSSDGRFHLTPEDTVTVVGAIDAATRPRIGGPRFVDPDQKAEADLLVADPRTLEQLRYDTFLGLFTAGINADPSTAPRSAGPAVKIIVVDTDHTSDQPDNFSFVTGQIEGTTATVGRATIDRLICTDGWRHYLIDSDGQVLDRGRDERTFTPKQRDAIALRDGWCMDPNCTKPPNQTEAHHIEHWLRDHGETNTDNGILLCRWHHLTYHRLGYEIIRDPHGKYWLQPPTTIDPNQTLIYMPSQTTAIRTLQQA